jgi:histidyl-tRNA synthetase
LTKFLSNHIDSLGEIDRERMRRNPLRVLDSKEEGMDALLEEAPHIVDYLCDDCASHFVDLRHLLDALNQPYTINFRLVRGIDYYTKTVFELWDRAIGAQASLCGGGRYDGLAEAIGGPPTPSVGVGIGIERIVIGLKEQGIEVPPTPAPSIIVTHFSGQTKTAAVQLVYKLRAAGLGARLAFARERRSLKSQMREADKYDVTYTLIMGESELEQDAVTVRRMDSGDQQLVSLKEIVPWFNQELHDDRPA